MDDIHLARSDPAAAQAKAAKDREEMLAAAPGDIAAGFPTLLSPTDAAALTGELADYLAASMRDGHLSLGENHVPAVHAWLSDRR